jgi:hypothetical protein
MPEIMKTETDGARLGDVHYRFPLGHETLVSVAPVLSVELARTVSLMTVRVPSIPARTSAGRQTRARKRVRRSGLSTALA